MPVNADFPPQQSSLRGGRIWLSGAVPKYEGIEPSEKSIVGFVQEFSRQVFKRGGHIVHGSHPSLTPTLLDVAKQFHTEGGRKDALILAISRHWSKDISKTLDVWRESAIVYETPESTRDNAREESLQILRRWLAASCDAVVVVGGNPADFNPPHDGIPLEIKIAIERGMPCFILGGLGGVAHDLVEWNRNLLSELRNGLDFGTNLELCRAVNVSDLAHQVCIHLERLPLVRGRGQDGVSFRILALDGGGLKGTFTASALATWEKQTGQRIVDHFDLIAGTSTGGILAIGLGLGLTGVEMLNFYRDRGSTIFPITRLRGRVFHQIRHIFCPKYAQEVLLQELENAYYRNKKPICLRDSRCRLVIPTYHAVGGASHIFRTPHHEELTADAETEAAHAALATSAAPTFFSAAKISNMVAESSYFDGGVWANSPAMAAIIEAVCFLRVPLERIDLLSVGTTDSPFTVRNETKAGVIGWIWKKKILDLLLHVQQESALKLAKLLVGEPRFLRVNSTTPAGIYRLDSPAEIGELADLGNLEALKPETLRQIRSRFLNGVSTLPWQRYG